MMIAGGFTCQRYGFNVGADKFSLLTIENGKSKHYAPIGMDIDFPKPKISLRQAASSTNPFRHLSYGFQTDLPLHLLQFRFCQRDNSSIPTEGSLHLIEYPGTSAAL